MMKIESVQEANQFILGKIARVEDEIVLGFLPVSEAEEDSIVAQVKETLSSNATVTIFGLLRAYPGATAFAVAVVASRELTIGGQFYPALENGLDLSIPTSDRSRFATDFEMTCERLGVLPGRLRNTNFKNPAPIIFQAGILHYWLDPFQSGLRSLLKKVPAPDLQDLDAVGRFRDRLGEQIHGQPLLHRALESDVGPLVVMRLVRAMDEGDDSVLPSHLRKPFREALKASGTATHSLPSPFLAYDLASGDVVIVLPKLSPALMGEDTFWKMDGRSFRTGREHRIAPRNETTSIELTGLRGELEDQTFTLNSGLNATVPFRIFQARGNWRERKWSANESSVEVPAGDYCLVAAPGISACAEDDCEFEERNGFRVWETFPMRPGEEPIILSEGIEGKEWTISCMLTAGFFHEREREGAIELESGEWVYFSKVPEVIAYFPKEVSGEETGDFEFTIKVDEHANADFSDAVSFSHSGNEYLRFSESLRQPLAEAVESLPPGIHRFELALASASRKVRKVFWFWKGLSRISESLGFVCDGGWPENLDLSKSKGVEKDGTRLAFAEKFHAPAKVIALSKPQAELTFPRPGVQAMLFDPEQDFEETPDPHRLEIISEQDKRSIRFDSGGFQRWKLHCGDQVVAELSPKNKWHVQSVAGLAHACGGNGIVTATGADGAKVRLFSFSKPLAASGLNYAVAENRFDTWTFSLPTEELEQVGVRLTDLSSDPGMEAEEIRVLTTADNAFSDVVCDLRTGFRVSTRLVPSGGRSALSIRTWFDPEKLRRKFLLVDFVLRGNSEAEWVPLHAVEKFGYSSMRLIFFGGEKMAPEDGWWSQLRSARWSDCADENPGELHECLDSISDENLENVLCRCRELSGWKYPGSVWKIAKRTRHFPVYLGRSSFATSGNRAELWWRHGASELAANTRANQSAVMNQLLFASQPDCLQIEPAFLNRVPVDQVEMPLLSALGIGREIWESGDLATSLADYYHNDIVNPDVIYSFENFQAVSLGSAPSFGAFKFQQFFKSCGDNAIALDIDGARRFTVTSLLSPEHLLSAVRMLNRRCVLLEQAKNSHHNHSLVDMARKVKSIRKELFKIAPSIHSELEIRTDFREPGTERYVKFWQPPGLQDTWSRDIAAALWCVTAAARLSANRRIPRDKADHWIRTLLCADSDADLRENIGILLNFAPELFGFYVALFDIAFAELYQKLNPTLSTPAKK